MLKFKRDKNNLQKDSRFYMQWRDSTKREREDKDKEEDAQREKKRKHTKMKRLRLFLVKKCQYKS